MISAENGKPMKQALAEADRCVQTLIFSAVEARSLAGRGIPLDAHPAGAGHLGFTIRVPVGVVAAITPFNFPLTLAAHKIGPAVAAGCGVVLKPADKAPLTAIELVRAFHRAGLPPAWMSVLVGEPVPIADALIADERVRPADLHRLRRDRLGPQGQGGQEARHPRARQRDAGDRVRRRRPGRRRHDERGQRLRVRRAVLHQRAARDRARERARRVRREARRRRRPPSRPATPPTPTTDVGPAITPEARDRVDAMVDDAIGAGAHELTGGTFGDGHRRPTVLDGVDTDQPVWNKEVFGPVISIASFETLDEAIDLANGTEYGLQAGIFTARPARARSTRSTACASAASPSTRRRSSAWTRCRTAARRPPATRRKARTTPCAR